MWISTAANPSKTKESPKSSLGKNKVGPSKQSTQSKCCFLREMRRVIWMPVSEKPADVKTCTTSSRSSETAASHQKERVLTLSRPPCFSCFILSLRRFECQHAFLLLSHHSPSESGRPCLRTSALPGEWLACPSSEDLPADAMLACT